MYSRRKPLDLEELRSILILTIGNITVKKDSSHYLGSCVVRYRRLRVEQKRKFAYHPRSRDVIRVSSIAESAGKRETTSHREIPLVN